MKTHQVLAGFALSALVTYSAAAQTKLGVIDLQKVFAGYYKTKAADAVFNDRLASLEKEKKAMLEQYQKITDEYKKALDDANDQAVAADEREKRKKTAEGKLLDIKALEQSINDFDRTARTSLDEQRRRIIENILGEIRKVIDAKAKSGGFSLVVDTTGESRNSMTPIVLYTNGENDLSADVLKQLNATAPPEASKPSEKKEEKK
jgi:Skp family chaperone for outer membrane proteins